MGREIKDEGHRGHEQEEPGPCRHPGLGGGVVEAEDVVDVYWGFRIGQNGAGTGHEKVADQKQEPRCGCPEWQGAAIVTEAGDEEEKEKWKPAVEERESAREERDLRVEHIIGHA